MLRQYCAFLADSRFPSFSFVCAQVFSWSSCLFFLSSLCGPFDAIIPRGVGVLSASSSIRTPLAPTPADVNVPLSSFSFFSPWRIRSRCWVRASSQRASQGSSIKEEQCPAPFSPLPRPPAFSSSALGLSFSPQSPRASHGRRTLEDTSRVSFVLFLSCGSSS